MARNKGNKISSGPQQREQNQKWPPTKGKKITSGPLQRGRKSETIPNKGEQNQKWLPHPRLLGGPKEGGNATSTLHSRASPTLGAGSKIRSGPQQRGTKSEVVTNKAEQNDKGLTDPYLLGGPKEGGNATSLLHSQRSPTLGAGSTIRSGPQQRRTNQKWLPHPYLLGGPKEGKNAMSPLQSPKSPA